MNGRLFHMADDIREARFALCWVMGQQSEEKEIWSTQAG